MTEINYSTTGIVLAAGSSKRFGENKLLTKLKNKPVIQYSLEEFQEAGFINSIIVVTSDSVKSAILDIIEKKKLDKVKNVISGGKTRQHSVRNALYFLKKNKLKCSYVSIHDGARPLIKAKDIDKCIQGAVKYKATTVGIRSKDTVKQAESAFSKTIKTTYPRELLWVIQTPQAFQYDLIYEAHASAEKNNFISTDDCALVEKYGIQPEIIEGDYRNLKITTPEDIKIASVLIS